MKQENPEHETAQALRHTIFLLYIVVCLTGLLGVSCLLLGPPDLFGVVVGSLCVFGAIHTAAIIIPKIEATIKVIEDVQDQIEEHH